MAELVAIVALVVLGGVGGLCALFLFAAVLVGPREAWDGLTKRRAGRG